MYILWDQPRAKTAIGLKKAAIFKIKLRFIPKA